ncbi:predicted protein [Naegleria gruberi]|uniref:Predicted protein n=1 Tax=Naegleria gruberi TaxID=5762 RepID=D2VPG6_NAEGR|nr:uncharacterized protein NAEGRDRAFT_70853 [Naegleria gruberi]EFC41428.1 predicted protein [Naegleria gruberi]|eukprot:XP_002674172.1 predicted protein [Naegleria gruberi strain NEG-M]
MSSRLHKTYFFVELEQLTGCKYSQIKILKSNSERATVLQCLSEVVGDEANQNVSDYEKNNNNNIRNIVVRVVRRVDEEEEPEQYEVLERERNAARVVSLLNHHHIVEILGFYEGDSYVYTLMPFYEIGDLQQLSKKTNLSENTIALLTYQLSKALRALHADQNSKVVHRDIELDNIFVEEYDEKTGNVKIRLADFEMCEVVDSSRITCTNIGRLHNNPPTNEVGSSLDIWCLGVIIYRLLSEDKTTDFHRDFKTQPEIDKFILKAFNKKLPNSDLKWAIIACLQIDKQKRISSRILMEYLLRIILVEDKFDESTNPNLVAMKLIY